MGFSCHVIFPFLWERNSWSLYVQNILRGKIRILIFTICLKFDKSTKGYVSPPPLTAFLYMYMVWMTFLKLQSHCRSIHDFMKSNIWIWNVFIFDRMSAATMECAHADVVNASLCTAGIHASGVRLCWPISKTKLSFNMLVIMKIMDILWRKNELRFV